MSKITIIFITVLLSISVLGIIGFQGFWLVRAVDVKDTQIRRDIQQILEREAASMENKEVKSVLLSSVEDSTTSGTAIQLLKNSDTTTHNPKEVHILTISSNIDFEGEVDHKVLDTISSFLTKKVELLSARLQHMAEEVIRQQLDAPKPSIERIDLQAVHQRLEKTLLENQLPIDFEVGLLIGDEQEVEVLDSLMSKDNLKESPFKASLFQQDLYPSKDQLAVHFPNLQKDVLSSMIGLLVASGFFLFLISGTYILTIRTILKQKKVSDIKTDFINNMTHEFKTPVATVGLAADALENPKVYQNEKELFYYTDVIRQENKRMNQHIENVLQMALVDKRDFRLRMEDCDIHSLLEEVKGHMILNAEKQEGAIALNFEAHVSSVCIDANHIKNVLVNLVDNALKYHKGKPHVTLTTQSSSSHVIVYVKDNGIGMTNETQQQIFGKFFRLGTGDIHDVKGFGLGLSYSKAIVLAHGGEINVQSKLGKGSTFILKLPL